VSLPWQYSTPNFSPFRSATLLDRLHARFPRRQRTRLSDISFHIADAGSDRRSRTRLIAVAKGAEAECLNVAFYRFVELHGRVATDPGSRCSLQTGIARGADRIEPKIVTLWNARAAAQFDRFWCAYRRVYGGKGDYALSPAA
jgi:hypothetical protein